MNKQDKGHFERSNFMVNTVPVDVLAPWSAGASAGTAMAGFGRRMHMVRNFKPGNFPAILYILLRRLIETQPTAIRRYVNNFANILILSQP